MGSKIIGYVKNPITKEVFPYIDITEVGYKVKFDESIEPKWVSKSLLDEVDGPEEHQTNTHIKNVHDIIDRQQEKGLKKYGTLVNKDDYSLIGWIEHAQQEAADLLIYLEVIKSKVKDVIG